MSKNEDKSEQINDALQANTIEDFVDSKRKQLGLIQDELHEFVGDYSYFLKRSKQTRISQDNAKGLLKLFDGQAKKHGLPVLTTEEIQHFHTLNEKKRAAPSDFSRQAQTLKRLFKGLDRHNRQFNSQHHILPTPNMLEALESKNYDSWNAQKEELMKSASDGTFLYMRGFNASHYDLKTVDLSRCDLIGMEWPRTPNNAVPASLKGAAIGKSTTDAGKVYDHLPYMLLRNKYQEDNPQPFPIAPQTEDSPPWVDELEGPKTVELEDGYGELNLHYFVKRRLTHLKDLVLEPSNAKELSDGVSMARVQTVLTQGIEKKQEDRIERLAKALRLDEDGKKALADANDRTLEEKAAKNKTPTHTVTHATEETQKLPGKGHAARR